jgi:sugar phosphate permease
MPQMATGFGRRWWSVGVLSALYVFSFVDRTILALLVVPLKHDLDVSDTDLGLLFGPAFAFFYALVGLPIARLADRGNRRNLVSAGVLLWSFATIASGFASNFRQLIFLRIGLAIGEAALTPSAMSMIGGLFEPARRSRAASVYSAVGIIGASGSYIVGALIIQWMARLAAGGGFPLAPWRLTLVLTGMAPLLIGVLFAVTAGEPPRPHDAVGGVRLREVATYLVRQKRLYVGLFVGAGLIQAIGYAYAAWGPELLVRHYHWMIARAGMAFGLAGLLSGFGGTLVAPLLSQRLIRHGRPDGMVWISAGALVIGALAAVAAPLQTSSLAFLILYGVSAFFLIGATNNVLTSIPALAPSEICATLIAVQLMAITLLGVGLGPPGVIALAHLAGSADLNLGFTLLVPAIALPALGFLLFSGPALRRPKSEPRRL